MGRPSQAPARRAEIVAAFVDELGEHGYDGTSMARLGAAAGLKPSLMHYYFPSKLAILLASVPALERAFGERRDRFARAATTPGGRLSALVDAHLALDAHSDPRHVAAWIQLFALAPREPSVGAAVAGVLRRRHAELAAAVGGKGAKMRATAVLAAILGMFQLAALCPELIDKGGAAAAVKGQIHG